MVLLSSDLPFSPPNYALRAAARGGGWGGSPCISFKRNPLYQLTEITFGHSWMLSQDVVMGPQKELEAN